VTGNVQIIVKNGRPKSTSRVLTATHSIVHSDLLTVDSVHVTVIVPHGTRDGGGPSVAVWRIYSGEAGTH